jgi:glyoxylase-like metal-dependent hydrolase (beta-lactamase superfamily II)
MREHDRENRDEDGTVHDRMLRAASEWPFALADRLDKSLGESAVPSRVIQSEPENGWRRDGGGLLHFAIGDIEVAVIVDDDDFPLPLRAFLPQLDLAAIEPRYDPIAPEFVDLDRDRLRCAIQSFALKLDRRTILVDACIGERKDRPEIPVWSQRSRTGWLDRLRAAGVAPESVDFVFCTHLHIDHVGWNTIDVDGVWRPTFPNARYLVGRRELADWEARIAAGLAAPMHVRGLRDSVFPLVEVGRVDLVDEGLELAAGAALTLLPGHTVGHMGLRIDRPEARALFCGDAMHSPLQIVQPAVSTSSCSDPQLAAQTRIAVLEEAAASGRVVVPAHFRGTRRVTVTGRAGGFLPSFPV